AIEKKWQDKWEETGAFHAETTSKKPKFYTMIEFPYPSGAGLHVGHPRSYTALDIIARKRRMEGYNVLYPIGWDAFGLPTENFAIKNKVHPKIVTAKNIANFTRQLKMLGFSFDWSREINTTDPSYYKWTQWIFLQLFKHGLAYKQEMPINWCTGCKVGLSNEEVVNGVCERCGSEVVQKRKSQWMLKITEYAQRLIDDLDDVNYLEKIKTQQKNWIGRSEGAEVKFKLSTGDEMIVYTTRADTLFGATYTVMSPEHPLIEKMKDSITNYDEVLAYKTEAAKKSEFERTELAKEKTGVKLEGIYAVNPANGAKLPVFISDYVLVTYGTGAIMAVPAHDSRDWDFAKKFNLPIIEVVSGGKNVQEEAYTDVYKGNMVNSEFLNGLPVKEAIPTMIEWLEKQGLGKRKVNFKLRDWVFSRQRYWGEPIPLVHCDKCGWVPIPESELPLELPEIETFEPGENGESPLAKAYDWIETTCPCCGGKAQRETDTMPQWAGSSWYFLRYMDPHNDEALASKEALEYWSPVDWYNGCMEHTTLHLLYSRFWNKLLYVIGVVPTKEPYMKRTSHG
ncbi:MAG: leucine--tRNA ligase, partial [Hominilimicola sp.]